MCDERTVEENETVLGAVSRRTFAAGAAAAAMSAAAEAQARKAVSVTESDVKITTPDGVADAYLVHPKKGKHPGVIVWPDILGLRPAFRTMGKRLAEQGYAVLTVNPYYRMAASPVVPAGASFQDPAIRERVMPLARALTPQTNVTDALAFVKFLDAQAAVDAKRGIGATGYCMGGPMTMRTAAAAPGRIRAGASFHGGGLVTAEPNSPHLLVKDMKASYLFAIAENDDKSAPDVKDVLRDTFAQASLPAEIEVYAGAMHGWCAIDSAVYNQPQAERAWARLLALFERALA